MAINITDLFASVVPDLAQQDTQQGQVLAQNLTTPGAGFALGMPAINRQMRRGVGNLFGVDTRSPAEKLQESLGSVDTTSPAGRQQAIKMLQDQGFGTQALQLKMAFQEQDRAQAESESVIKRREAQSLYERQQTALQTAELSENVRQSDLNQEERLRVRKSQRDAGAAVFRNTRDESLAAMVSSGQMTPSDAITTHTNLNQWKRLNSGIIFNPVTGESKDLPNPDAIETFNLGNGLAVGLNGATGDVVWTKNLNDINANPDQAGAGIEFAPSGSETYNASLEDSLASTQALNQSIAQAIDIIDEGSLLFGLNTAAGVVPAIVESMGSDVTNAALLQRKRNLEAVINTVKSNVAFDRLQKMRDESPTGGALGQVSELELKLLENSLGVLDSAADPEILIKGLQDVMRHYENFLLAEMRQNLNIDFEDENYAGKVARTPSGEVMVKDETGTWMVVENMGQPLELEKP